MAIEIEAPQRARGMVHKLIADTAKGMASEHFEELSRNNDFHKRWPHLKPFVGHNWRLYIPMARSVLTGMLGNPNLAEEKKRIIYDAILKDGAINPKPMAIPEKPRFFLGPT